METNLENEMGVLDLMVEWLFKHSFTKKKLRIGMQKLYCT